jgi:hypothetical protein
MKCLNFEHTKYSREERNNFPKFKTLEDNQIDEHEEDGQKIINLDPSIKRSKTPSNFNKPSNISNLRHKMSKMNPLQYYENTSGTVKSAMREEIEFGLSRLKAKSQISQAIQSMKRPQSLMEGRLINSEVGKNGHKVKCPKYIREMIKSDGSSK